MRLRCDLWVRGHHRDDRPFGGHRWKRCGRVCPAPIPVRGESGSIGSLKDEAHGRLAHATLLIAESGSLRGTFNEHKALSLHPPEGRLVAAIEPDRATVADDSADDRILSGVTHAIANTHVLEADFRRKRSTHGRPMLARARLQASYSASLSDI